jgi:GDP-L-fucose synthase
MNKNAKIYVAGHTGLVGSALMRGLDRHGYTNIVTRKYPGMDLGSQLEVEEFFKSEKPEYVLLAAAMVGGIIANNTYRADFIYKNIQIQNNVIHNSYKYGVKKLLFLGSSCIYPKDAPQPLKEEYLLTSPLEYTNEPYAIAKIAGIKMCESYNIQYGTNFISVMPTNLYGPGDNYNLGTSHVLPALIRKFHLGKCLEKNNWDHLRTDLDKRPIEGIKGKANDAQILDIIAKYGIKKNNGKVRITLWGTGKPMREFLHSDNLADACIFLMSNTDFKDLTALSATMGDNQPEIRNTHINIGSGTDLTIRDLAQTIKEITGFKGSISWDQTKPDGTPRKLMDVSKLEKLGWKATITLKEGLRKVYDHYKL